jgi:hypothetical protein
MQFFSNRALPIVGPGDGLPALEAGAVLLLAHHFFKVCKALPTNKFI